MRFLDLHPKGIDRLPNSKSIRKPPSDLLISRCHFIILCSDLKSLYVKISNFRRYSCCHLSHAHLHRPLSSALSHLRPCLRSSSDSRPSPSPIPPQQFNLIRWRDPRMLCSPRQRSPRQHSRLYSRAQSHSPRTVLGRSCRMVRRWVRATSSTPMELGLLCYCIVSKIRHGRGRVFATDGHCYGDGCSYGLCGDE